MSEWTYAKLGDMLKVHHGFAFPGAGMTDDLSGHPIVVSIGNFNYTGGFRFESTRVREFRGDYPREFELAPGELLVVMTCQTSGGEILGVPGIIPDDGRVYLHNQRIGRVEVIGDRLCKRFAYYLFLTSEVNRQLFSTASGTKILHTSPGRIEDAVCCFPPPREQDGIASVLGALDDKIAVNGRIAATAEDLALTLASGERWEGRVRLDELCVLRKDQASPQEILNDFVDHYSLPAFDAGKAPERVTPESIKSSKFSVTEPAVLLSKLNPEIPRIWNVTPNPGVPSLASTEFLVLTPRGTLTTHELWAVTAQQSFLDDLASKVTGTSKSHQRVRPAEVLAAKVIDPRQFGETGPQLQSLASRAVLARRESQNLATLRDALLPQLMSGRLRVKDAEKIVEDHA